MTRVYEVNPTTEIPYQREPEKREWIEGQVMPQGESLNNGAKGITIIPTQFDLVLATESSDEPGQYQFWEVPRYSLAFVGASVSDPAARVVETARIGSLTLDELRQRKQFELSSYVDDVRHQNCATNLVPNWVVRIELPDREWYGSVNGFLQDRMRDRVYDGDPKDYWARDVPIRIININNNRYLTQDVNESQWGQIMKDIGLHDFSTVDAADLVQADIDAAYGDGSGVPGGPEWQALAAIDVQEPTYGWPPVYRPEISPTGNGR